jgi:hypothetical protein
MEGGMSHTDQLEPTAKLRWVRNGKQYTLQQWWSNQANVKMGPTHMVKGEWKDVPMEQEE